MNNFTVVFLLCYLTWSKHHAVCCYGFTFHGVLLWNWQFEHSLAIHQPKDEDVAMEASADRNDLRSPQVCCLNMPKLKGEWLEGVELMDISPSPRV